MYYFVVLDALQVATNHHGLPRANHAVVAPYPGALHTTRSDVVINNHTEKRFMRKRGKQETVLLPAAAYHFYHSILSRFSVAFHFLMSMIRGCRDSGVCTSIIRILRVSGSQVTGHSHTGYLLPGIIHIPGRVDQSTFIILIKIIIIHPVPNPNFRFLDF